MEGSVRRDVVKLVFNINGCGGEGRTYFVDQMQKMSFIPNPIKSHFNIISQCILHYSASNSD